LWLSPTWFLFRQVQPRFFSTPSLFPIVVPSLSLFSVSSPPVTIPPPFRVVHTPFVDTCCSSPPFPFLTPSPVVHILLSLFFEPCILFLFLYLMSSYGVLLFFCFRSLPSLSLPLSCFFSIVGCTVLLFVAPLCHLPPFLGLFPHSLSLHYVLLCPFLFMRAHHESF